MALIRDFGYGNEDEYIELPEDEWQNLSQWVGPNVSLTSLVLTEWDMIQKEYRSGTSQNTWMPISVFGDMISGISPGEVMYIGQENAKISAAIMLNIIKNRGIEKKNRILYYNQSQGQNFFTKALLSLCSGIPEMELQHGWNLTQEAYRHLEGVVTDIRNAEVTVVGTLNINIETIMEDVCGLDKEKLPALILINGLRFLTAKKKCKSKQKLYRYIAEKLHQLARDMRIPIIITGPIAENRTGVCDWPLTIGDMPATHMEEHFDKILMIYPELIREGKHTLDVSVIKNPDGWHGCYQMAYLPDCNEIRETEL